MDNTYTTEPHNNYCNRICIPKNTLTNILSGAHEGHLPTEMLIHTLSNSEIHTSDTLKKLGDAYKQGYMSKILPRLLDPITTKEQGELAKGAKSANPIVNKVKKSLHLVPEVAAYAAAITGEPTAVGVNVFKRVMGSDAAYNFHPQLRKFIDYGSDKLLYTPLKKEFQEAMEGTLKPENPVTNIINRDVINPVDFDIAHTSRQMARVISASPEHQAALHLKDTSSDIKAIGDHAATYDKIRDFAVENNIATHPVVSGILDRYRGFIKNKAVNTAEGLKPALPTKIEASSMLKKQPAFLAYSGVLGQGADIQRNANIGYNSGNLVNSRVQQSFGKALDNLKDTTISNINYGLKPVLNRYA